MALRRSVVAQKVSSWMKQAREWFCSVRGDSHIDEIDLEKDRTHNERPRFAIGQGAEGDWLLIAC